MTRNEDRALLEAEPISKVRMALLALSADELSGVEMALGGRASAAVVLAAHPHGAPLEVTREDVAWARGFESLQDAAQAAAGREDYEGAVRLYREALAHAPGCDIFLMSLGVCYAQLDDPARGVSFLERAVEISPENERIRRNLEAAGAALDLLDED